MWEYATRIKTSDGKVSGQCKRCNRIISCVQGSNSSLFTHLGTHGINLKREAETSDDSSNDGIIDPATQHFSSPQPLTPLFFKRNQSLSEIVADMAIDGISFNAITNNKFIRESVSRVGLKLPESPSGVANLVRKQANIQKAELIGLLKKKKEQGVKFSMGIDEVTTVRNRRYFSINLHASNEKADINLGLVRIFGSMPAEKMVEAVEEHVESFGLIFAEDIVCSTHDGAPVMAKYGRLLEALSQLCLNHAIHLGVCDTLYKKVVPNTSAAAEETGEAEEVEPIDEDDDDDLLDQGDGELFNSEVELDEDSFMDVLKNVRKLVKFYRLSPVRNNVLQQRVMQRYGKEKQLSLDVKTRWNSISTMLESVLAIKEQVIETSQELRSDLAEKVDFEAVQNLHDALKPVKVTVDALSRQDATLISADISINFMLRKLNEQDNTISLELAKNLLERVEHRMNKPVMYLLESLRDSSKPPSKATIAFAQEIMTRLFPFPSKCSTTAETEHEGEAASQMDDEKTLQEELDDMLKGAYEGPERDEQHQGNAQFKALKSEFVLFKNTNQRTTNLQRLYGALLTIKPTSTDVERLFSSTTFFCTKIRSRLADTSLNALVFLKFSKQRAKKLAAIANKEQELAKEKSARASPSASTSGGPIEIDDED